MRCSSPSCSGTKPVRSQALASDAQALLQAHAWPGNVRELKNVIERAHVLSGASKVIEAAHLLIQRRTSRSTLMSGAPLAGEIEIPLSGKSLREIEREAVHLTLSATGGNQSRAAKLLGISRPTLPRIVREMSSDSIRLVEASRQCVVSRGSAQ